jgi:glycosyltransferase involved in cell wall biosynthesis
VKVSIVTISFNQAEYIERTISSILAQNYPSIEYLVVDAGSTDGSRERINNFRGRIARIILESDKGPADGLNKGFRDATGEIFGFVNGDDVLLPNAVASVVQAFQVDESADVVYGHGYVIDHKDSVLRRVYADRFDVRQFAFGCVSFIQPSVFFKSSAFQKVGGFNTDNKTCWDGELLLDMAIAGCHFMRIEHFISAFRLHSESISGSGSRRAEYVRDRRRLEGKAFDHVGQSYTTIGACRARLRKWRLNPRGFWAGIRYYAVGSLAAILKGR